MHVLFVNRCKTVYVTYREDLLDEELLNKETDESMVRVHVQRVKIGLVYGEHYLLSED